MKKIIWAIGLTVITCVDIRANEVESEELSSESMMRVAEKMRLQEDNETAAGIYTKLLAKTPENAEARLKLAAIMQDEEYFTEAINELVKIPKDNNLYEDAKTQIVLCHIAANQPEKAKILLTKMIKDDDKARYYNLIGVCCDMQMDHANAQKYYAQALDKNSDYLGAKSNLGLSLAFAGQHDEAIKTLVEVTQSPHSTAKDRQNLAVAYTLAKKPDLAEQIFSSDMDPKIAKKNVEYITKYGAR